MIVNHIASGSSGNCIIVSDGKSKLMLDAGLSFNKISQKVTISEMEAILISHEHADHSCAAYKMVQRGYIPYMSMGTAEALDLKGYDYNRVQHLQQFEIGSWVVVPFNLKHDCAEPMGYLFQSRETGKKGVFIVDSAYVEYNFPGISHYLIEANYAEALLAESDDHPALKRRIRGNHFSLENLKVFLQTSDLSKTEEIHLLHLSRRNANEKQFRSEIEALTGVPTFSINGQ